MIDYDKQEPSLLRKILCFFGIHKYLLTEVVKF